MRKPHSFRVLIIDDNPAIHQDFIKILTPAIAKKKQLKDTEKILFEEKSKNNKFPKFIIDTASQGQEGVKYVANAVQEGNPYALAFVDIRMPPGWDGIETIKQIWKMDDNIQVVICTAYSDYSWEETEEHLGQKENLFILKKPFDYDEVRQLSVALTKKWRLWRGIREHTKTFHQHNLRRLNMETDLCRAIDNDELFLCYQPQYHLAENKLVSAEALIRWLHPTKGLILPVDFIPLAEEMNLVSLLTEWALRTACEQNKSWQDMGLIPIRIAVNITAQEFGQIDLVKTIQDILKKTQLKPEYLEIEITENIIINSLDAIDKLAQIKKSGVIIAIDDFGTGYSNLSYLKKIPLNRLKIDQSFIQNISISKSDEAIIQAIITVAKSLNLEVLAEGVETQNQVDFLKSNGCDAVQGFYFNKPLRAREFEDLLRLRK